MKNGMYEATNLESLGADAAEARAARKWFIGRR